MPYDSSLDQRVDSRMWEGDGDRITVSVYSYNNGAKKMQISRENLNKEGEYRFAKLGRLTKEEASAIIPLMQELVDNLD